MDYRSTNQKTYNSIASDWNKKREHYWKPVEDFLKEQDREGKFLDLGCGSGRFLQCAKNLEFKDLVGCDFSEGLLEITKEKGFKTIQAELTNLPFEDREFKTIICIAAHHHLLEREEQLKSLEEMNRILNEDGTILLSNWMPDQDYIEKEIEKGKFEFIDKQDVKVTYTQENKKYDRYYHLFEEDELKKLCEEAKFKTQRTFVEDGNIYLILTKN